MQKKSLALLEQVQEIIGQYSFALTLRQIYYQLVSKQIIPNKEKYYKQLSRLCVIGRDEGQLPEEAFADRLREIQKPSTWTDLKDFFESVRNSYRKNKWVNQDTYIEIWTEKDALRGVISPITERWDVGLLVVRGQVSRTAIYEAYERFKLYEDKNCYLFYYGDFDPSGFSIYDSLTERIQSFGSIDTHFERMALTPEQIQEYNLPQDPAKKSDPNYRRFVEKYGDNVVELDALPPNVLRELIENSITNLIAEDKWEQAQKKETQEEKKLKELKNL